MEGSLKRREPTILRLAKDYNDLCHQIAVLIRQNKAPAGAVPPQEIVREGLFKLDVDDEIWQDVGLDDEFGCPPLWLSDERVRQGIQYLLERDRCEEEEVRLVRERRALQEWLQEEWQVNQTAHTLAGQLFILILSPSLTTITGDDSNIVYQLDLHAEELCRLCVIWRRNLRPLPGNELGDTWGPSEQDLQKASKVEFNPNWGEGDPINEDDGGPEDNDWEDIDETIDNDLVESMEAVAFTDEYHLGEGDHFFYSDVDVTPAGSPRK